MLLGQIPDPTSVINAATKHSWEAGTIVFLFVSVLFGVAFALWKFSWYIIYRTFGNTEKGTRGTVGEWVDGEKEWQKAMTESIIKQTERVEAQTEVCVVHVATVKALGDSLSQQVTMAQAAHDAASCAAAAAAESNASLSHIDEVLTGRTDMITHTAQGVQDLKECAFHMCDACQKFIAREFPNSVGEVSAYLLAIKKKVNDEK